MNLWKS